MPTCRNSTLEPSPKGKGRCAFNSKRGKQDTGNDGCVWEVAVDKRGRKYWKRLGDLFPNPDGTGGCLRPAEGYGDAADAAKLQAVVAYLAAHPAALASFGDPRLWGPVDAAPYVLHLNTVRAREVVEAATSLME